MSAPITQTIKVVKPSTFGDMPVNATLTYHIERIDGEAGPAEDRYIIFDGQGNRIADRIDYWDFCDFVMNNFEVKT